MRKKISQIWKLLRNKNIEVISESEKLEYERQIYEYGVRAFGNAMISYYMLNGKDVSGLGKQLKQKSPLEVFQTLLEDFDKILREKEENYTQSIGNIKNELQVLTDKITELQSDFLILVRKITENTVNILFTNFKSFDIKQQRKAVRLICDALYRYEITNIRNELKSYAIIDSNFIAWRSQVEKYQLILPETTDQGLKGVLLPREVLSELVMSVAKRRKYILEKTIFPLLNDQRLLLLPECPNHIKAKYGSFFRKNPRKDMADAAIVGWYDLIRDKIYPEVFTRDKTILKVILEQIKMKNHKK